MYWGSGIIGKDHTRRMVMDINALVTEILDYDYSISDPMTLLLLVAGVIAVAMTIAFVSVAVSKSKIAAAAERRVAGYRHVTLQSLTAVVSSIDARDPYCRNHSVRVAEFSVEIARRLGFTDLENLYYIALLHDIGKIGISDDVLRRVGSLQPSEYAVMKQHTDIGSKMLKKISAIPDISDGAKYHHEHYDGTGYNYGLKGEQIPLVGRIICVADSYVAMTSARSYRRGLTNGEAIKELERCAGTQFDPQIVHVMVEMLQDGFDVK